MRVKNVYHIGWGVPSTQVNLLGEGQRVANISVGWPAVRVGSVPVPIGFSLT